MASLITDTVLDIGGIILSPTGIPDQIREGVRNYRRTTKEISAIRRRQIDIMYEQRRYNQNIYQAIFGIAIIGGGIMLYNYWIGNSKDEK
jgi:hypothetical protein